MQAIYSDEHRFLDDGYGVKYETAAIHPSLLVTFSPWRGGRHHARIMEALPNSVPIGVLLRDRDGGEVRVGRDGSPIVKYKLSGLRHRPRAQGRGRSGADPRGRGAQRIFTSHSELVAYDPGRNGGREQFMRDADALWLGRRPLHLRLLPHHGLGADGRLAHHVRVQPARARRGRCATSTCATAPPSRPPRASTR